MKTKIKRHYRSVVSVLLSVCMLISCMTVGLIATDAAQGTGDESVGWNGDPTYVNLHLWKVGTTYTGDTVMTTKNQHYTVSFGNLPDRSSINFGLNARDSNDGDKWLIPTTNVDNTSVGDERKYIWMKTDGRNQAMSFDTGCDYEVWWDSTDNNGNGIQISFKKAPQNNPTKITAPSGCTASVTEGTNTITSAGSASSGSLTQNSTATVTITPPTGKKVTTATLTGGTSQTLNLTSNHDGTYSATYTVPSNTTETAITFSDPVDKSSYKVNVVSSDVSEGTVAATVGGPPLNSDAFYPEDTAITLTATEGDGFSFVKWDYKTTTDSSANPATYYVNGEDATGTTINITGEFGENGYQIKIGSGSWNVMEQLKNGNYISTSTVANETKFQLKRTEDGYLANNSSNAADYWINNEGVDTVTWVESTTNAYSNRQGGARYVVYNPTTQKVWLSDDPQGHTPTTVLVKRGAVFSDGNGANISSTGTSVKNGNNVVSATVAGANKTGGFSDQWQEKNSNPAVYYVRQVDFTAAEVGKGAKITVATTVTDNTLKVVGFVVNGESVLGSDITHSGNTYTMTYTIPEYPDPVIEITPVYAKTSGTIRFYVEGVDGDIRTKWGDTVYCYAYYGSAGTTATYGLGTWPGQPLLYDNGRYFIDLAEYDGNNKINGIALNNGTWDTVHAYRILGSQTDSDKNTNQCQSYDYDDFEKINDLENEKKAENSSYVKADIIFEMKSKGVVTPENSNFGKTFDTSGSSYPSKIDVKNFTGWEYLTDYYGKRVDVFGNIINPTDTHYSDEPYRLVSQGYDENSVGYFATAWVVYQKSGSTYNKLTSVGYNGYVGTDSESKFLDSGLENQEGWSALKGKPAMITYEYGVYQEKGNDGHSDDGGNKPATRYDGRWYVSKVVPVKAHTLIEYGRTEHGTFRRDYYQENNIDYTSATGYDSTKTEGLVTKTRAHFSESNLTESEKYTEKNEDGSSKYKFNFVAEDDVEGKYTFIGWYKYNAKGEAERVSTKKNYSVDVKNEEVLIARFIKTPAGTVTITHELLTGSEGLGTTLNSVSVVESDKTALVAAFDPNPVTDRSTGAAKLPSIALTVENTFDTTHAYADRGRLVKIVLDTTPNGATFQHFHYDIDKSGNPAQLTASAPGSPFEITVDEASATATIYIPLSYFFKEENGDKIFDEDKDTLKFYSELIVSSKSFTVTKKLADYTESDAFTIKVETSTNGTSWSDYANQAYTSTGTDGNTDGTGLASIHQNETLTFANIAVGTYVRITETATVKDYIFDSASAVKQNDSASPKTDISTSATNGCSFQITDDDVDVTINNKRQEYTWIIKSTYNSRLWSTQGYQAEGTFTKDQLDTYTTYTEVTDYATGNTVHGIKFKSPEDRAAFVANYLPHEDNFRQEVTLNPGSSSENYYAADKQISMGLTASYDDAERLTVQYKFPCEMKHTSTGSVATNKDANGHAIVDGSSATTLTIDKNVLYMNWYCLNNVILSNGVPNGDPVFVSAPESIIDETDGNKVKYFHHWSVKTADGNVEYTKCYNREYNYAFYQDSIVTPVYVEADQPFDHTVVSEEERIENPATITFLEASRNQWNNKQCGTAKNVWNANGLYSDYGDRIFVDFVLDLHYIENGINLQLNTIPVEQRSKYHAGLLIQQLGELDKYTEGEHEGEYITDSAHYASKYASEDGKTAAMTALTGGTATKANSYYNSVISVADFDNKNELEYYYNFANISQSADYRTRTNYKNYAFRAYTYLYVEGGQRIISAPVYFTMYDIASIENLYDIAQTKS